MLLEIGEVNLHVELESLPVLCIILRLRIVFVLDELLEAMTVLDQLLSPLVVIALLELYECVLVISKITWGIIIISNVNFCLFDISIEANLQLINLILSVSLLYILNKKTPLE